MAKTWRRNFAESLGGWVNLSSLRPTASSRTRAMPEDFLERPTVLFFGRLEYYKGLDLFVEAVERAAQAIPDLRAIITGKGPEAIRCRALVRRPDLFEWRDGFVPDSALPDLFGEVSLVVLPYRDASQSGVIPLAFANRRPVIVTAVGSLAEAVDDGVDGLVVDRPSAVAIAECIVKAFVEPGLLERIAANALTTATEGRFSTKQVAKAHLDAYRTVIAHTTLRGRNLERGDQQQVRAL